jgi:hypothetical protein
MLKYKPHCTLVENHRPVTDKLDHIMLYRVHLAIENHRPVTDKLDHIMLYRVHLAIENLYLHAEI